MKLNLIKAIPNYSPGILLAIVVTIFAFFISSNLKLPVMLVALFLGMILNSLSRKLIFEAGIAFSATQILRLGVAFLGFRLSFENINNLGYLPISFVIILVLFTFFSGIGIAYLFKNKLAIGCLIGGSVAVCGASAALAVASVIPKKKIDEKEIFIVILGVTILSTIVMVIYPFLAQMLQLKDDVSGFLMGSTIHDVAQVVGAGYSISDESGIIATFTKMIRVATLPIIVIIVSHIFNADSKKKLSLPWFILFFIFAAIINNLAQFSGLLFNSLQQISSILLVIAISALGLKTNIIQISKVKFSFIMIIIIDTLIMLALALLGISIIF